MKETLLTIGLDYKISAVLSGPPPGMAAQSAGIVVAHGAANDMNHPLISAFSRGLSARGFWCLRFNFPYRERNQTALDPEPELIRTWARAAKTLQRETGRTALVAAGKSLGARIAAQAAATGAIRPQGLIFLGYPLHAPGNRDRLRDAPLYQIQAPMLFFEGTRDPFCDLSLLGQVFSRITAPKELVIIENGDHGLALPDLTPERVIHDHIIQTAADWLLS